MRMCRLIANKKLDLPKKADSRKSAAGFELASTTLDVELMSVYSSETGAQLMAKLSCTLFL